MRRLPGALRLEIGHEEAGGFPGCRRILARQIIVGAENIALVLFDDALPHHAPVADHGRELQRAASTAG